MDRYAYCTHSLQTCTLYDLRPCIGVFAQSNHIASRLKNQSVSSSQSKRDILRLSGIPSFAGVV